MRLLDAGSGLGLETARLAAEHPETLVTGLDRNAELLGIARQRAGPRPANLLWLEADLAAVELPEAPFDAIRTERVLMYATAATASASVKSVAERIRPSVSQWWASTKCSSSLLSGR